MRNSVNTFKDKDKKKKIIISYTLAILLIFYSLSMGYSPNSASGVIQEEEHNKKISKQQLQEKQLSSNSKIIIPKDLKTTINSGDPPSISNFNLKTGFKIEPVLWNLTLSSSITFDDEGNMYIAEAGYAPGGLETTPRILKIDLNGTVSSFVDRDLYGPITDIDYYKGKIYVSNRAKISTVDTKTAEVKDIIVGLPSLGDFRNNQLAFGPDGRLYFGQGTATNSGIIGKDNYEWLKLIPILHNIPKFSDIPARNVTFTGQNFVSVDNVKTGAFVPFGNSTKEGQVIKGDKKCSGCILSTKLDGSDLKVVGWGLRNPYGLAFVNEDNNSNNNDTGKLLVTAQGAENRGNRPIANDPDKIYSIDISNPNSTGSFYGWPDFFGNAEPVTDPKFKPSNYNQSLKFIIKDHPNVKKPLSLINSSAGISQITFSNNSKFGFKGQSIISQFGTLNNTISNIKNNNNSSADSNSSKIIVNQMLGNTSNNNTNEIFNNNTNINTDNNINNNTSKGQKIIVFDLNNRNFTDFLSLKNPDPGFRPIDVKFNNDGDSLYVVSFAKAELRNTNPNTNSSLLQETPWFYKHTGVLWKISNSTTVAYDIHEQNKFKKISLSPELKVTLNSGDPPNLIQFLNIPNGYKMTPILWNMDLPGSFAFDDNGNIYVASTGVTYGQVSTTPEIYKIDKNGKVSLLVDRPLHGILTDIEFNHNNGLLYVAHRNLVSTVNVTTGVVQDLVIGLPVPVYVTHPMGQLAIGPDERIYFSVGGLSNTAVPDLSDWGIGWIKEMPFMHEIPGQNITLTGQNFMSKNFISPDSDDRTITGGMMPFGTPSVEGQKISGETRCTSCILSIAPDGSDLRLHAWGIRNAYGMVFDEKGRLFAVSNGDDDKGIRRVTYDPDSIFLLDINQKNLTYFGWPDFPANNGESIIEQKFSESPAQHYPNKPLIKDPPKVTPPYIELGMSVGNAQAAYSINDNFGFKGKIFITEFGTIAPVTHIFHKPLERSVGDIMGKIIGQKIVMVDPNTKSVSDFISLNNPVASFRPVGLGFTNDGSTMYLSSIEKEVERKVTPLGGILPTTTDYPFLKTGTIWKIEKVAESSNKSSSPPILGNVNENIANNDQTYFNNDINSTSPNNNTTLNDLIPYIGNTAKEILDNHTKQNDMSLRSNNNNNSSTIINSSNLVTKIVKGASLLREFAFQPSHLTIQKGSTVTWNNEDLVTHTVTSGSGFDDPQMGKEFDSGLIGKTFKHIFKKTGEYPYFCQVHPTMQGKVIVK